MSGNGGELSSFLTKLSEDPELQERYMSDPRGTLRDAGVADETIDVLLSRDLGQIKAALERELPPGSVLFMVLTESLL